MNVDNPIKHPLRGSLTMDSLLVSLSLSLSLTDCCHPSSTMNYCTRNVGIPLTTLNYKKNNPFKKITNCYIFLPSSTTYGSLILQKMKVIKN